MTEEYKIESFCQRCQKYGHIANFCESYIFLEIGKPVQKSPNNIRFKTIKFNTLREIINPQTSYSQIPNINSVIALEA
jgi:hypothetical protein